MLLNKLLITFVLLLLGIPSFANCEEGTPLVWNLKDSGKFFDKQYLWGHWYWQYDLAYETLYENGPIDSYWQKEVLGMHMWSNISYGTQFTFFSLYQIQFNTTFTIFDVTPYKQMVKWVRPEFILDGSANIWDMSIQGLYDINILQLETKIKQNIETSVYSWIDYIRYSSNSNYYPYPSSKDSFYFDKQFATSYKEKNLSGDFYRFLLKSNPYWYGKNKIWYAIYFMQPEKNQYFSTTEPLAAVYSNASYAPPSEEPTIKDPNNPNGPDGPTPLDEVSFLEPLFEEQTI